ncbi:MAG: DUF2586 family protein [Bacteroidales bacterium]|nr:DUF2586 family protein [Bacteroidales bacterium]
MSRPDVKLNLTNGNLGREVASKDGVALLIVSAVSVVDKFALGDVIGPIYKPEDADAYGINAAYDLANTLLAYQHIVDFYAEAGNGAPLYLMPVAQTVTMEEICDKTKTYAATAIESLNGEVRLVIVTRVPDAGYAATVLNGLDDDVIAAAIKAQALAVASFAAFRPVSFLIEGRDYQGVPGSALDLRSLADGPNANRVGIVISADPDVSAADADHAAYANVALVGGRLASIGVQRDPGRVRDGALNVTKMGLSDASNVDDVSETDLVALHDKGYIFGWKHTGLAGYYINMGHAACPIADDYAYLSRGRTIDKAARLIRQVYIQDLLDEIEVDSDGKLSTGVIKNFQSRGESTIRTNMLAKKEASGVGVYVDPAQNVLSTDKLIVELKITPMGIAKEIVVNLGFTNPATA